MHWGWGGEKVAGGVTPQEGIQGKSPGKKLEKTAETHRPVE